jgi:NAD(P)-dependent dehydrogenase (short-subunit alcohol dehydrogenase family)
MSQGRVQGKKALITGGAGGLGSASAWMLARHGAKVTLTDLNLAAAQKVADAINAELGAGTAFAFAHDVTSEAQWIDVLDKANAAMGGLSILVNNAGISTGGNVEQLDLDAWRKVMSVNVDSVFLGCKHAIGYMKDHQPGSIVNLSSIAGLIAAHSSPVYNASKAAVWLLSKSVALHCAKQKLDIRSNTIHPTFISTPILDPLRQMFGTEEAEAKLARQIPLGRIGEPNDVAYAVLYLASDESRFVTGAELKVDGGISAM